MGLPSLSSLSPSKQVLQCFEEEMAPKNVILQSSKKETSRSTSEGAAKTSIASDNRSIRLMTRSMTKAAAFITLKQQVMAQLFNYAKVQTLAPTCLLMA